MKIAPHDNLQNGDPKVLTEKRGEENLPNGAIGVLNRQQFQVT